MNCDYSPTSIAESPICPVKVNQEQKIFLLMYKKTSFVKFLQLLKPDNILKQKDEWIYSVVDVF